MPKGPAFRHSNAARHTARLKPILWYEQCGLVDPRLLRIQLALEEEGFLTYETRLDLRDMISEIQTPKEKKARRIERTEPTHLPSETNWGTEGVPG